MALRHQAEVADSDEVRRQDVKQEATERLGPCEVHHPRLVAVSAISVAKADSVVVERHDSPVADGDPVGIAGQILEYGVGL